MLAFVLVQPGSPVMEVTAQLHQSRPPGQPPYPRPACTLEFPTDALPVCTLLEVTSYFSG